MRMSKIKSIWSRIEISVRARDPGKLQEFPQGTTLEEIQEVEEAINVRLPKDVRDSYLLHNGSARIWISDFGFLMPLIDRDARRPTSGFGVLNLWQKMLRVSEDLGDERSAPVGPIRNDHWNTRWVPLTENDCGDFICLDLAPAKGGRRGQVIEWWARGGAQRVLANSFIEWLENLFPEA